MFDAYSAASVLWWEPLWFQNPQIAQMLDEHFIFTQLYVDDATRLPSPVTLADGQRLHRQGEVLLQLEENWIQQNQAIFLVLSRVRNGKVEPLLPILALQDHPRSTDQFMDYLQAGLSAFRAR